MEFREQITIGVVFFVFAYFASLGFWQVLAKWQSFKALSWLPTEVNRRWSYLLGSLFMVLACLWFFGTRTEEIFSPGPASSEFLFFLSTGLLLALVTTICCSPVTDRVWTSVGGRPEAEYPHKESIAVKWVRGTLYLPNSDDGPWPAVCLVPEPGKGSESLEGIASGFADSGFAALALDMGAAGSQDLWRFPDVLILFPQAISYLDARDEIDASRVGVAGVGLGGDLAIRAAAEDRQIKAGVALAPVLVEENSKPGLDLLREMSYPEAVHWTRLHQGGELVNQLGARQQISKLDSQPLLVIYGEEDRVVSPLGTDERDHGAVIKVIAGLGHLDLVRDGRVLSSATDWFRRHL